MKLLGYSILRYLPCKYKGEFKNVGVISYSHETDEIKYSFNDNTGDKICDNGVKAISQEIDSFIGQADDNMKLFKEIVKPKESLLIYSEIRVSLYQDKFEEEVLSLYKKTVDRKKNVEINAWEPMSKKPQESKMYLLSCRFIDKQTVMAFYDSTADLWVNPVINEPYDLVSLDAWSEMPKHINA